MTIDSVASTWSYCIGCPTLMLIMMPVFLECIGFISLPSSPVAETITEGCKAGVFDVSNYLFAQSLLYSLATHTHTHTLTRTHSHAHSRTNFTNPNIHNMKKIADLYAEVIGVLMLSVCRGELHVSVGWSKGIDVKARVHQEEYATPVHKRHSSRPLRHRYQLL